MTPKKKNKYAIQAKLTREKEAFVKSIIRELPKQLDSLYNVTPFRKDCFVYHPLDALSPHDLEWLLGEMVDKMIAEKKIVF